jgi:hypothetical protein
MNTVRVYMLRHPVQLTNTKPSAYQHFNKGIEVPYEDIHSSWEHETGALGSHGSPVLTTCVIWLQSQRYWVRLPAFSDFPRGSGCGTVSTQPREKK